MNEYRVLITGVAGFIGSNLADKLSSIQGGGFKIIGVDNLAYGVKEQIPANVDFHEMDIRSKEVYPLFHGVDVVFHLAAKNCISDCQADPVETAAINVSGTVNVFEAARRANVKRVVYAESSAMYEGCDIFPTPENDVKPESFYAISKLAEMYFAQAYERYYDMHFTALRYFNVYGPRQDYRRTIPPVMSAFVINLLRGQTPIIYGTGEKRRDFIFVDDVNDFHLMCISDPRTIGKVFNIGSGENHSVGEIYSIVSRLLGKDVQPLHKPDLPGESQITLSDISEAMKLGWRPKVGIQEGLQKMIEWIKTNVVERER